MNLQDVRAAWKAPNEFHHGWRRYWYDMGGAYRVHVMQDTEIWFSSDTGIGFDMPVPGRYTVKVQLPDYRVAVRQLVNVRGHGDLRNRACRWIASLTTAYERGETVNAA